MVTRDVLKVLKLHSPTARASLRTFKTSLVPINLEMHSRSYDFQYILPLFVKSQMKNAKQNRELKKVKSTRYLFYVSLVK